MKKILILLMLFPLFTFAKSENILSEGITECVSGVIKTIQYDSDGTISIKVGNYDFYTNRTRLAPMLFSAFTNGMAVTIYTHSCEEGGGFAKIKFKLSE